MSGIEIALLIIGFAVIVVSFIFSTKLDGTSDGQTGNATSAELTERQRASIEKQIVDIFDEKMEEETAKQASQMDLLVATRKKEMDEYSETILNEINRNHNEVMFLYDMLNEKKKEVTNTVRNADAVNRMAMEAAKEASRNNLSENGGQASQPLSAISSNTVPEERESSASEDIAAALAFTQKTTTRKRKTTTDKTAEPSGKPVSNSKSIKEEPLTVAPKKTSRNSSRTAANRVKESLQKEKAEENKQPRDLETGNNNEKILELNKAGKSNVEIAKELGIGIGEVKLVIDLFKGGRS